MEGSTCEGVDPDVMGPVGPGPARNARSSASRSLVVDEHALRGDDGVVDQESRLDGGNTSSRVKRSAVDAHGPRGFTRTTR